MFAFRAFQICIVLALTGLSLLPAAVSATPQVICITEFDSAGSIKSQVSILVAEDMYVSDSTLTIDPQTGDLLSSTTTTYSSTDEGGISCDEVTSPCDVDVVCGGDCLSVLFPEDQGEVDSIIPDECYRRMGSCSRFDHVYAFSELCLPALEAELQSLLDSPWDARVYFYDEEMPQAGAGGTYDGMTNGDMTNADPATVNGDMTNTDPATANGDITNADPATMNGDSSNGDSAEATVDSEEVTNFEENLEVDGFENLVEPEPTPDPFDVEIDCLDCYPDDYENVA